MLRSMTGFGSGQATVGTESISVELKTVNHKFCEVKARLPRELSTLEPLVLKLVRAQVSRGAVDLNVRRALKSATGLLPQPDLALAREYRRAFSEIAQALGLPDEISLAQLAMLPEVIRVEAPQVQLEEATSALTNALELALHGLASMRSNEGKALHAELVTRLSSVSHLVQELKRIAPRSVDEYRKRLSDRIAELSRPVPLDAQRLAQEVAFFAERTDVSEEMARLEAHVKQFEMLLASEEPVGRKMDFLVQEMHREANTTGSKSQHPETSTCVLQLKAELEKIREQVQNIE